MQAPPPSNAIQNNQRLFGPFSRKLASDDQAIYAAFAEKFAAWLSDERAYYLEARPEILKILKIAQLTLRRNVGANPDLKSPFHISSCIEHPMVASYSRLLRAIHLFRDRFVEPDLQAEIKSLLKTITVPVPRIINSTDSMMDAHSPTRGITPLPKHNASTSEQPSSPTPVSVLQMRPSLSSHMQPAHGVSGVVQASFQTPSPISAVAANGRTTTPSPAVAANSVPMPQYSTAPLPPAAVSSPSQSVSVAPTLVSLASSKEPEHTHLNLSPQALHDPLRIAALTFNPTRLPTRHALTPASIPLGKNLAHSNPRKKKKKLDVGLESLIQADLQELRTRGVTVKQELAEPTTLSKIFDTPDTQTLTAEGAPGSTEPIPATQHASDALAGTTMRPQPEVIVLDHDNFYSSADISRQNFREIDAKMSINELCGQSLPHTSSSRNALVGITTGITAMKCGNNNTVEEAGRPVLPLYNGHPAGAVSRCASTEDIDMADSTALGSTGPTTKTDLKVDEVMLQTDRVVPPLPRTDVPHADSVPHGTIQDTMQTISPNMDATCGVPVVSHATPNAVMDVDTMNMEPSLLREPHAGVVRPTSAHPSHGVSSKLDAAILKLGNTEIMGQCNGATPVATHTTSASEVPTQRSPMPTHCVSVCKVGSMTESHTSIHGDSNAAITLPRPGSTSPTASVIPNPVLLQGVTDLTSTRGIGGYMPASELRTALEPVAMNAVLSMIDKPSEGPPLPLGLTLSASNITIGVEHHHVSETNGIPSVSVPEVKEHTAEELRALYAFGPGTVTLAIHKGLVKKSKATIRFDIPEEQFEALSLWRNRKNHTKGLKDSLCLTLSCYSRVSVKAETKTLDEVCALPSVWPATGDLSMNVMHQGKRTNFPLSPPFVVAPNGLVDVSDFLQVGSNVIELDQFADMSAYIFILRAHRPTSAQLEQVAQRRRKNQAWKDWLLRMSQPFEVPTPSAF